MKMQLNNLLTKFYENVTVWISEDPSKCEGIYFGAVGDMKLRTAAPYDVVEIYPEHYPAIGNLAGITVIVKKRGA